MWGLRVLSGPHSGHVYHLKQGKNLIGRAPNVDIKILTPGISKEHAEIHVFPDRLILVDLKSSNGSFINGVRVQNSVVRLGDKIGFHDLILDIIPVAESRSVVSSPHGLHQTYSNGPMTNGNAALSMTPPMHHGAVGLNQGPTPVGLEVHDSLGTQAQMSASGVANWNQKIQDYVENVMLPGVYRLASVIEMRMVMILFVAAFAVGVTALSMIPMVALTKASIQQEAKRRALSLARSVAQQNQQSLLQGNITSLSVGNVETEDGVKQVLIVQQSDGLILAPASRAGSVADLPFVHRARKESKQQVSVVDSDTIGASFPIGQYNPNTGEPEVKAHALVLYDVSSLKFDDGRVLSLFMQTLVIAALLGSILFFFMWRLIEYPLKDLNRQLDVALREKRDDLQSAIHFPAFQALVGNVSSLLTRYISNESVVGGHGSAVNKTAEAESLIGLIGRPAAAISDQGRILAANDGFLQLSRSGDITNKSLQAIADTSLQQMLEALMQQCRGNLGSPQTDQLEFNGYNCLVQCQAVASSTNEVDYFVISIAPIEGGG